jgi:hypothetical protein
MKRRLSKEESRQRYAEGRKLWNEFDPIGVFTIDGDWPQDEYEGYVGPCLRLCEEGKGVEDLESYIRWVVHDRMGLSETEQGKKAARLFAMKFLEWYRTTWPDTTV